MQSIDLETWEQFEEELKNHNITIGEDHLFRGQAKACWLLQTTLERNGKQGLAFRDYYRLIYMVRSQIETFTANTWALPTPPEMDSFDTLNLLIGGAGAGTDFPIGAYSYMAYLRHHNFPSPLLDWTRTPYVAAYFAFRNAAKERVAIYVYREYARGGKTWSSADPAIRPLGPYVKAHRRHYLQQSEYTICLHFSDGWHFSPHDRVFSQDRPNQDLLWKFTLPATERIKVLKLLDSHNLNAFSLFESDEALLETLAFRHIDLKSLPWRAKLPASSSAIEVK